MFIEFESPSSTLGSEIERGVMYPAPFFFFKGDTMILAFSLVVLMIFFYLLVCSADR